MRSHGSLRLQPITSEGYAYNAHELSHQARHGSLELWASPKRWGQGISSLNLACFVANTKSSSPYLRTQMATIAELTRQLLSPNPQPVVIATDDRGNQSAVCSDENWSITNTTAALTAAMISTCHASKEESWSLTLAVSLMETHLSLFTQVAALVLPPAAAMWYRISLNKALMGLDDAAMREHRAGILLAVRLMECSDFNSVAHRALQMLDISAKRVPAENLQVVVNPEHYRQLVNNKLMFINACLGDNNISSKARLWHLVEWAAHDHDWINFIRFGVESRPKPTTTVKQIWTEIDPVKESARHFVESISRPRKQDKSPMQSNSKEDSSDSNSDS